MAEHEMRIAREEQRKRGWHLAWSCTAKDCDARGNVTVPSQGAAWQLFGLVAEGHKRTEGVS